jgi:quercetin dioxygenase-like cupin family protein
MSALAFLKRFIARPAQVASLVPSSKAVTKKVADRFDFSQPRVFVEFGPGVAPRNHRTDSIDYAVVMSGEIDMQLDDTVVHLKAGDVLVQRGTIHNWFNHGTQPCVMAFVLIDARPVEVGGKVLNAAG